MATPIETNLNSETLTYNGVTWGDGGGDHSVLPPEISASAVAIEDESGRQVKYIEWSITATAHVGQLATATAADQNLDEIVRLLSEPNKALELSGLGLGFADDPVDVVWGPFPTVYSVDAIGQLSSKISWGCRLRTKYSPQGVNRTLFLSFGYTTDLSFDEAGRCTRKISGAVEFPRNPKDFGRENPLSRKDKIRCLIPVGFQRAGWNLSENATKNRLNFSFTDREMVAPYPAGMVNATGSFTLGGQGSAGAFNQGAASLSMNLQVKQGLPRSLCREIFLRAIEAKHRELISGIGGVNNGKNLYIAVATLTAGLFDDANKFQGQCQWLVTAGDMSALLIRHNLWQPLHATDFRAWRASVETIHRGNSGASDVGVTAGEDVIIDLGDATTQATIGNLTQNRVEALPGHGSGGVVGEEQKHGYVMADVKIRRYRAQSTARHQKATALPNKNGGQGADPSDPFPEMPGVAKAEDVVVEKLSPADDTVVLYYKLIKVGDPPPAPSLKALGGKTLECTDAGDETSEIVRMGDVAMHKRVGYKRYTPTDAPPEKVAPVADDALVGDLPDGRLSILAQATLIAGNSQGAGAREQLLALYRSAGMDARAIIRAQRAAGWF